MADPITWHVTMLGELGQNTEGPLPWIERDYTPISSAREWELGRCEILIKIYNDGKLTSWLKRERMMAQSENKPKVWLSKPLRTLSVPSLIPEDDDGFRPRSILLILAGTGIVALPQILAHRNPYQMLGIATPKYKQLGVPIDLVFSCREDDILLLPQIKGYCEEGMESSSNYRGLRSCTILISKAKQVSNEEVPFGKGGTVAETGTTTLSDLKSLANVTLMHGTRLSKSIVSNAIDKMTQPCRVVVSGPDQYNKAAREYLGGCGFDMDCVTILSA